ncbi:MAG TPA: cobyric acid synthase [Terracidiphilus sp.]|jgi:adenosylcobyric acid synthase|nr:cobyric acid synthase [Terracidiphilus sp.]
MTARAIMVLGTASHVGKSLMTAALCRIFARVGYSVAPFKAQNMSLNSAATPDGYEIGRAQALQAEAAGIPPSVHMNPILIKPSGDCSSQIVVRGKVWGNLDASTYHKHRVITLLPIVEESYRELASRHDIVVLEGAGSPAEINLKDSDIVNMRMAKMAQAPCLLVGDIDRGGVFASLLGTCELLDEEERGYVRGFIINKFRGDLMLLEPGVRTMEERIGKPCMGVIPYLKNLTLDEEDSVGFGQRERPPWPEQRTSSRRLQIGVVAFPSISNFTDFDALDAEPSVALKYFHEPDRIEAADVLILPGSKQTVDDLRWMQERGFDRALLRHAEEGGLIAGICGGFQMLGREIVDSSGAERVGTEAGLGLLSVRTIMTQGKVTVPARGTLDRGLLFGQVSDSCEVNGYEIHLGTTEYLDGAAPFASLVRRGDETKTHADGCVSTDQRIFGTYLHGIFDADSFRRAFLRASRAALQMPPPLQLIAWSERRRQQLDLLADAFGEALDLDAIFGMVGLPFRSGQVERVLP